MEQKEQLEFKIGQIVRNRNRLWRVDNIDFEKNIMTATAIDGSANARHLFYIPMENIQTGRLTPISSNIIGNPRQFKLMLQAFKLSILNGTAPFASLRRSRVIPTSYQLVPLVMSFRMPKVRLLIADDIGMGKTIEAGLILNELIFKMNCQKVLIICPAVLRNQWANAMKYFFHIDTKIVSTAHLRKLERTVPPGYDVWEFYDVFISSMDYAKQDTIKHRIFTQEWDVVIIDEAHNVAKPHTESSRAEPKMERYRFAKELVHKCNHLMLLTATPHNGYKDTFLSLLNFLDVDLIDFSQKPPEIFRRRAQRFICQRTLKGVKNWFSEHKNEKDPFPNRPKIPPKKINPSIKFLELFEKMDQLEEDIKDNIINRDEIDLYILLILLHFKRRLLSSPEAFRRSIKNRLYQVNKKLVDENGDLISLELTENVIMDQDVDDIDENDASSLIDKLLIHADLNKQESLLLDLLKDAEELSYEEDAKLMYLFDNLLPEMFSGDRKPKAIIYTKYTDTLEYLEEYLRNNKIIQHPVEIISIHGGMD